MCCGSRDGTPDACSKCCTVNSLFWVYMLGLAGTFASLFFFFWQYPGTLTQFMGPKGESYAFTEGDSGELLIFRDNLLIGAGTLNSSEYITDIRKGRCRGTSLLWTMLISGFLGVLWLLWLFVQGPQRFICCSLQQPYREMHQQMYPSMPVTIKPMGVNVNPVTKPAAPVTMPAPMTPPQSPGPKLA